MKLWSALGNLLRSISTVLLLLVLSGCERAPSDPVVSKTEKWFVVTNFSPPKHFYVSFREEGTGFQFKDQYVSKHCNAWRKLKIGSRWKLTEVVRQGRNSRYSEIEGVRYEFCDKISSL
jgi:hypothetical protein